jgi:SAM-dependent methyltransferase
MTMSDGARYAGMRLAATLTEFDRAAWSLAALAVTTTADAGDPLGAAAAEVVNSLGLAVAVRDAPFTPAQLAGMASSSLLQPAALAHGGVDGWAEHSDETLRMQGQASGAAAGMFAHFLLPHFGDLAQRLATPGARMIDVGTGIGALAVGFATQFPHLDVTGIDVLDRALDLARETVAEAGLADRVHVRRQDVADLDEPAGYDLAWLPAPFVPRPALEAGIARLAAALRPGGMLMIGHGRFDGTELDNALTRFKTVSFGGTPLDAPSAQALLRDAGMASVSTVPTPPGTPAITVGLR